MTEAEAIAKRIESFGAGRAFTAADFSDVAGRRNAANALGRLHAKGGIARAIRGVYYAPERSALAHRPAPAQVERRSAGMREGAEDIGECTIDRERRIPCGQGVERVERPPVGPGETGVGAAQEGGDRKGEALHKGHLLPDGQVEQPRRTERGIEDQKRRCRTHHIPKICQERGFGCAVVDLRNRATAAMERHRPASMR